jgi:hypothetical protein
VIAAFLSTSLLLTGRDRASQMALVHWAGSFLTATPRQVSVASGFDSCLVLRSSLISSIARWSVNLSLFPVNSTSHMSAWCYLPPRLCSSDLITIHRSHLPRPSIQFFEMLTVVAPCAPVLLTGPQGRRNIPYPRNFRSPRSSLRSVTSKRKSRENSLVFALVRLPGGVFR